MSESLNHPTTERLQAFVEESIDEGGRMRVDEHLSGCPVCRTEVEELRGLFAELSTLNAFAPSPAFADHVMARVRVPRPAFAGAFASAEAWLGRLIPQTTRGWAAAAAVLALPVLGATLLITWLMSQPGVTPQGLWMMSTRLLGDAFNSGWQWAWTRFAGTTLATWLAQGIELLETVGGEEIGLAAVVFATLTMGSAYVLYQNLFRTDPRRSDHATYVF